MFRCVVEKNEQLTPSTLLLTLRYAMDESKTFGFHPGQYAALSFHKGRRISHARCFSIVSSPTEPDKIQFGIRIGGRYTHAMRTVQPGEEVDVRGPFGGFVINPQKHTELILIAGGIGITPFISMLRYVHATQYPHAVHLLYGVQDQHDIPFYEELCTLAASTPNLHITFAVSHGGVGRLVGQNVVQQRIDGALLHQAIEGKPQDKTIFICGPPPLMKSMIEAAAIRGVANDSIITEAFRQGQHRQSGKVVSWPRNMYVMGGLGIALGAFAISVNDIVKNLPAKHLVEESAAQRQLQNKSARAADLDQLVNSFPAEADAGKTASPATTQALNEAAATNTIASQPAPTATSSKTTTSTSTKTSTPTTTTPTTSTSATSNPTPTPTPAPTPTPTQPKCTTSQSGVTTCI